MANSRLVSDTKSCPSCNELLHISIKIYPEKVGWLSALFNARILSISKVIGIKKR